MIPGYIGVPSISSVVVPKVVISVIASVDVVVAADDVFSAS